MIGGCMFFEFGIKDFIDILLVAFVLYYTYKLMKASGSIKVFTGILVFILICFRHIDECGCNSVDCAFSR